MQSATLFNVYDEQQEAMWNYEFIAAVMFPGTAETRKLNSHLKLLFKCPSVSSQPCYEEASRPDCYIATSQFLKAQSNIIHKSGIIHVNSNNITALHIDKYKYKLAC